MSFRRIAPLLALAATLFGGGCAASGAETEDIDADTEPLTQSAGKLTTTNVQPTGFAHPFQNWDHDGANPDNPVSIIFVSEKANLVSRVYDQIGDVGLTHGGSKMTLEGIGGSRPGVSATDPWSSQSAGRKGAFGCWGQCDAKTDIHVRTYGPDGHDGTQVYQGTSGAGPYYLVATTHFDRNENTATADFGYQDQARSLLVTKMVGAHKWTVKGSVDVKNACDFRVDPRHLCQHDGHALVISIDG